MMSTSSMARRGQRSKKPMHLVISEKLREQIQNGLYSPGEQLPSEYDLGELFGVSRTTIRRAIANLIHQGLVSTQQGKGIFVKRREKISFSLSNPLMFFDTELHRQGFVSSIHPIRSQLVTAPSAISEHLNLTEKNSQVYLHEKIIFANAQPIAYDQTYLPKTIGESLAEQFQQKFTFSALEENGYSLKYAQVMLESTPATYEISEYLGVPLGSPLLAYRYVAFSHKHNPVVCGETLSRADCTCYSVELRRDES